MVKTPSKHPKTCRLCGAEIDPSPKGQPRLYCRPEVRPCKERFRVLKELGERAAAFDHDARPRIAEQIRTRARSLCREWKLDS